MSRPKNADGAETHGQRLEEAARRDLAERVKRYQESVALVPDEKKKEELRSLVENVALRGASSTTKQTEFDLMRKVWWWRYFPGALDPENPLVLTEDGKVLMEEFGVPRDDLMWIAQRMLRCQQYPAFVYEVAVRMLAPDLIPVPWLKLSNDVRLPLIDAFEQSNLYLGGIGILTPGSGPINPFWTREVCDYSFNLLQSDSAIAELFLEWHIRPARRNQGVPAPKPNKGVANRPFSWRAAEYIDLHRFGIKTKDAGASKQRSNAKREVAEALGIPISGKGTKAMR